MKGISRWIKSENLIKKMIKTILSSLRSQNNFLKRLAKRIFIFKFIYVSRVIFWYYKLSIFIL